ncbi:MAG: flagellar biosynthetic protein FliO [Lachnospiraceae bacterium]|nr:flagellar biosynthetic protein FliO [Lachnospiraceae bacterium]
MALIAAPSNIDSAAQFATVLLTFIFVLVITVFVTKFIGNYQKLQGSSKNFESIEACKLGNNSYLQLVRVGERYFALAVSKEGVTVVTELKREEIRFDDSSRSNSGQSFERLIEKAKSGLKNRGGDDK